MRRVNDDRRPGEARGDPPDDSRFRRLRVDNVGLKAVDQAVELPDGAEILEWPNRPRDGHTIERTACNILSA